MKDILVGSLRMHEVHSYIWFDAQKNKDLSIETNKGVRVINAQTPDHQYIRDTMIPTLLAFAKENRGYLDTFSIFEIGHTVNGLKVDGDCNEEKHLGAVLFSKTEGEEVLFMRARDAVVEIFENILHKTPKFVSEDREQSFCHPVNCFGLYADGVKVGYLSVPHPTVLSAIDKKCAIAFFELTVEKFAAVKPANIKYKEPSKFPAIDIDVTFSTDISAIVFDELVSAAKSAAGEILSDVKVQDIYTADGECALTLRFSFISKERTLTKQELMPTVDAVTAELAKLGVAVK